ncbi:MAG: STY0301 family protein [Burkholderiales bacterium]
MRIFLVITFALLPALVQAEVICPDTISVQQQATVPAGEWQVSVSPPPYKLVGITVYDGPPSQNRRVKSFQTRSGKGELKVSWRLPESRRNYHLVCDYERTAANLMTVLPPGVNGCNAVFDRRVSYGVEGLAIKRMVCN